MESVFKKFEKKSIDISKVYGGGVYATGQQSIVVGGETLSGQEGVTEDSITGCLVTWVKVEDTYYYLPAVC